MREVDHLTRGERNIAVRHSKAAGADIHEPALNLHRAGIGELHLRDAVGGTARLAALFLNLFLADRSYVDLGFRAHTIAPAFSDS